METKLKWEPSEKKGKSKCPVCKEDATLVCSGCQSVSYCCVDHQKKHWKLHRSSCVFFHIKDDPREFTGAGKFCAASRDLNAGAIILEEHPLIQMPSNDIHDRCITCAIELPPKSERNASHSCPKCNWPVCGTACAEFSLHASNECKVFVANRAPYPNVIAHSRLSQLILYPHWMRGYAVMTQNPQQWKEVEEMLESSHVESGTIGALLCSTPYPVKLKEITSASSHFPKIAKEDVDSVMGISLKLMRLASSQGYIIFIQEDSSASGHGWADTRDRVGVYVYKTARHFVHSCSPNCFWTVGTFPDFKMQIRTSVPVKKGEKLTVSRFIYKVDFANGTRNRQKQFQPHFHFPCRCDLCLDPTEFGTYQSAVVCELCKTDAVINSTPGYLLPIDPLNFADDAPWKCNFCKKMTTASQVNEKVEEISRDLQTKCGGIMVSGDKVCEAFIEMYRNKLIHPNHWLIQMAAKLIRIYQLPRLHLMNTEELSGFEKVMRFLLDLKDKTIPGIIHERIVIVHNLCIAMSRRLRSLFAQDEFCKELLKKSREDLLPILVELEKCQQYQNETMLLFKHPPNIERGQTVDYQLNSLRSDMKYTAELKTVVLTLLAQIETERLSLEIS